MNLNEGYNPAPHLKIAINVGACMDIPAGSWVQGRRGEWILLAGLQPITGVTGIPNSFKSTVLEENMMRACARMGKRTSAIEYDTEANKQENHVREIACRMPEFLGEDPFESVDGEQAPRIVITDKNEYTGDEFYAKFKHTMELKKKSAAKLMVETPFWNRKMDGPYTIMLPSFSAIDSFTAFETKDVIAMQDENDLGDSGANTLHMRQGLVKQRMLMEAPRLNNGNMNFMLMSAHLGKESAMQKGAGGKDTPVTKLSTLKNGDALKGVTGMFLSLTQNLWFIGGVRPQTAADGNGPEYPKDSSDKYKYDTDLNELSIKNLRGKAGSSGLGIKVMVSQREGVLSTLTEFHNCKENGRFGLEGNVQNYEMALRPGVRLSRTTVRNKIKEDPLLCRAINISSEMQQMQYYFDDEADLLCTPKELYDDLLAKGYDWDVLLRTRGWWTLIESECLFDPFLSTLDLLMMRKGLYHPFWLEADKKTIKPGYSRLAADMMAKAAIANAKKAAVEAVTA